MKRMIGAAIALGVVAVSCQKTASENNNATPDTALVMKTGVQIDSLRVVDSLAISETLTVDFRQKVLVFSGLQKQVLDSLYKGELFEGNSVLQDYSRTNIDKAVRERMNAFFEENKEQTKEYMPQTKRTWDLNKEMNVFTNAKDYLTIKYDGYGYTGGAHGYAYENYKVVDVTNQKKVELEDIIDVSKVNWNQLLLSKIGERKEMLFEPETVTYNQNFFFDDKTITLVYGQYEIAAYAAGIIPVTLPFSEISEALKPEFKQRMGIQ